MVARCHNISLVLAVASTLLSPPIFALEPVAILAPSDGPTGGFGRSVAISGDVIAVGDPYNSGFGGGAVYVYQRIGPNWIELDKLTGDWPRMGWSVAMDGDVIVAGAPFFDFPPCDILGVVFVFRRNDQGTPDDPSDDTWVQEGRLTAPDPESQFEDGFGRSVAVSGNVLVAGDCWEKAHVFRYDQDAWIHETTLISPDPESYQNFGHAVDIDGNRIVVGAPYFNDARGAAYVFFYSEHHWEPEDILTVTNSQVGDGLGSSVAIREDRIVSGAVGVDDAGFQSNSGATYVFHREPIGKWIQLQQLSPSIIRDSAQFGSAIGMDDDLMVAAGTVNGPPPSVFGRSSGQWVQIDTLSSPLTYPSVGIDGRYAIYINRIYVIRDRVSLQDFLAFQNCFGLSGENLAAEVCQTFDFNSNGQLEIEDFGEFLAKLGGP